MLRHASRSLLIAVTVGLAATVIQAAERVPGEEEFEALGNRYSAQLEKYWANVGEGKPAEEHERFVLKHWPGNTTNPEFLQLESKYRGTVIGLSSLYQIIATGSHGTPDAPSTISVRKALKVLNENYADHPDLDLFFFWLRDEQFASEIKAVLGNGTKSPHRYVRGAALLKLADIYKQESTIPARMADCLELMQGASGKLTELERVYR